MIGPALVSASIVTAVLVSYAAVELAGRVAAATGRVRLGWLIGGSVALGIGVWSMYFIAMFAFGLPAQIDGDPAAVFWSAVCAVGGSFLCLWVVINRLAATIERRMQHQTREITRVVSVLDATSDYVATSDAEGRFLSINRAGRAMLGIAADEDVRSMTVLSTYPSRLRAQLMRDQFPRAMTEGSWSGETHFLHRNGHEIPVSLVGMVHRASGGGVEFLSAVARDISEHVKVLDAIRDSEERFRQLAENIPEVFFVSAADLSRIFYVSPAYESIWGQHVQELYDDARAFLRPVHPDDVGRLIEAIGRVQAGEIQTLEFRLVHPDGSIRWVLDRVVPVRNPQGDVYRIVGVARDFTEQIAARETERTARVDAETTAAAKSAFLANMSHEIRTPMSGILGMVELLRDTELTPEQRRSLDVINASGDALLTVLNDVLDLSKIEAGQLSLESIPFDLSSVVDATVRVLAARAFERGLELVCDVQSDVPRHVRGDPSRLRQVLTNLLGNAIKFTHHGEVVLSVRLARGTPEEAAVEFAVRDTGIGISPEQIDRVFEPFGQADASTTRKYGGTGLGLSISRRLVGMMGGDISAESEVERGSTFRFELLFPIEVEVPALHLARRNVGLKGVRALVVDDNPTNRHLLQRMLSQAGADLGEASDVDKALEALRQGRREGNPYQLLVSDVQMPGGDGFDLARIVRDDSELAGLAIMLLTSGGQRGDGARCREFGVSAYLLKPVSRVDLLESATAVMDESRQAAGSQPPLVTRHLIEETRRALSILLAEDNPVNQEVATAMLRKRGHRVDVAHNGREAVDAVRRGGYDVVLMDLQMPVLDGVGATHEIRRLPDGGALPIIALTANVMAGERERCLAAGMDDYLGKPFKAHELFGAVEGWRVPPAAEERVQPDRVSPVDLAGFRSALREGGVEEALDDIITQFINDAPGRLAALEEAAATEDANAIARAAHAFKSAAGTIRAISLEEALRQTEAAGKSGNAQGAIALLQIVRSEYAATMSYLELNIAGRHTNA